MNHEIGDDAWHPHIPVSLPTTSAYSGGNADGLGSALWVFAVVGEVGSFSYTASSLRAKASSSLSCASTGDGASKGDGACELGFEPCECVSSGFMEEDEGTFSPSITNGLGCNLDCSGCGGES